LEQIAAELQVVIDAWPSLSQSTKIAILAMVKASRAMVRPDDSQQMFRNGLIGQARFKTSSRTLASRIYRYLSRTFNFDL
jgi:hypothetical protein